MGRLIRRRASVDARALRYEIRRYERGPEAHVIVASGELDLHAAPCMRETLSSLAASGRTHLVVDMSGATFIDSAMISVLSGYLRAAREGAGSLSVVCRSENILRTLEIAGIAHELQILDTLSDDAVQKVAALPRVHEQSKLLAAPRTQSLQLSPHPAELAFARGFAVAAARRVGLNPRQQYDLAVATNEAVANAIQHGEPGHNGPIEMWVEELRDGVTVGVRNRGEFVLDPLPPDPLREGGRGLRLMSQMVDAISVQRENAQIVVQLSIYR
jgi:anti-anti-sigma factor